MSGSAAAGEFTVEPIPDKLREKMLGKSFRENPNISLNDLVLVRAPYYGFDGTVHVGEMVIHHTLGEELLEIFKELCDKKFPIEKMKLIDEYDGDDDASMADNNSSAFCYRELTGGGELSSHAWGTAVDINPLYNPYVRKWEDDSALVLPPAGAQYLDRTQEQKGMILVGDDCYQAFIKRGWEWGGDWEEFSDYHHFQKI